MLSCLGGRKQEIQGSHCGREGVRVRVQQVQECVRDYDPPQGEVRGGPHHHHL